MVWTAVILISVPQTLGVPGISGWVGLQYGHNTIAVPFFSYSRGAISRVRVADSGGVMGLILGRCLFSNVCKFLLM
jgi:hypothetical protein